MWTTFRHFKVPPRTAVLWQFMSTEKLLALLSSRKLHLARMDTFDDPWEATVTDAMHALGLKDFGSESKHLWLERANRFRNRTFASCWHRNPVESAAMWDLYATRNAGVALRTTVSALQQSIQTTAELLIANVRYVDFRTFGSDANPFAAAALKRKSFKHEQEVRLIHFQSHPSTSEKMGTPGDSTSFFVDVDLQKLVRAVYVAPSAPSWHLPGLRELLSRFGLKPSLVQQSVLYDQRVW